MDKPICPITGQEMKRGNRSLTISYRGRNRTIDMPGWYVDGSDEGIHTGKDLKVSDRALNALKAEVEGLLSRAQIRRIRKKLKLTQVEAGEIIGGGPRAFQKYEAGDLLPSRAISSALILLDHDPGGLKQLCQSPEAKGKAVVALKSGPPEDGQKFSNRNLSLAIRHQPTGVVHRILKKSGLTGCGMDIKTNPSLWTPTSEPVTCQCAGCR